MHLIVCRLAACRSRETLAAFGVEEVQLLRWQIKREMLAQRDRIAIEAEGLHRRCADANMQDGAEAGRLDQFDRATETIFRRIEDEMFRPDADDNSSAVSNCTCAVACLVQRPLQRQREIVRQLDPARSAFLAIG